MAARVHTTMARADFALAFANMLLAVVAFSAGHAFGALACAAFAAACACGGICRARRAAILRRIEALTL